MLDASLCVSTSLKCDGKAVKSSAFSIILHNQGDSTTSMYSQVIGSNKYKETACEFCLERLHLLIKLKV